MIVERISLVVYAFGSVLTPGSQTKIRLDLVVPDVTGLSQAEGSPDTQSIASAEVLSEWIDLDVVIIVDRGCRSHGGLTVCR